MSGRGHHRPSGKRPRALPLPEAARPPSVDWTWWRQVLRLRDLRRHLHLEALDVRRLLGDETRDLTSYSRPQLRAAAEQLQRLADPRRRTRLQPVINRNRRPPQISGDQ